MNCFASSNGRWRNLFVIITKPNTIFHNTSKVIFNYYTYSISICRFDFCSWLWCTSISCALVTQIFALIIDEYCLLSIDLGQM